MAQKRIISIGLVTLALALSGCGSDVPTAEEVKATMDEIRDAKLAEIEKEKGAEVAKEARAILDKVGVEFAGCEPQPDKTAKCVLNLSAVGEPSKAKTMTFVKGNNGKWFIKI